MTSASPVEPPVDHASPHTLVLARRADTDDLGETIAALAARLHAATYELLVLLREFDERSGRNNGFLSCAHWLHSTPTRTPRASGAPAWRTGIDLGAAREKVYGDATPESAALHALALLAESALAANVDGRTAPATRRWCTCATTPTAACSTWAARPARSRHRSAVPSPPATPLAAFRAAPLAGATRITEIDGALTFLRPDGVPLHVAPAAPSDLPGGQHALPRVAGKLRTWDGSRFDLAWAIDVLYRRGPCPEGKPADDEGGGSCGNRPVVSKALVGALPV